MKSLIPCLVTVVALLFAVPAGSAEQEKTPQEIENLAKELVPKLGDPEYREREAASQELVKLGLGALKAIEEGCQNPDLEIAYRCESLLPVFRILELERRIEVLAADKEGLIANTLPLGATYESICGNDENAREFYIELCKNHLQLLDDAANNPEAMGEAYIYLINEIEIGGNGGLSPAADSAKTKVAALLLIGADEKLAASIAEASRVQPKGDRIHQRLIGILWKPEYEAVMIDANNGRYFRKLLFAWAKQLPESGTGMQSFLFFIQDMVNKQVMNLESDSDTLEFLMDFASSTYGQRMPYQKGTAMAMVSGASLSVNDQIAYFEGKLFKDQTILLPSIGFELDGAAEIRVETRACDYALAICVNLTGQSFKDYGFDILGSHSDMFESWTYAGFTKDETRKAAFKKYEEWRGANPISDNE